ncbi:tyrosine-type recombinase/integrase [Salinibacillus aidingensis]|uniref:Tyrosine-type recombinase/integrase n=1 Tax=Salinibacillus aidingensis TaxID=237684 RepID=A0ABN1BFK0_9BACI
MKGHFKKRGCKCDDMEVCTCKWTFVIDNGVHPETGKRRQKSKGNFNTKQEAQMAAIAFLEGDQVEEDETTFKDFTEEWLTHYIHRNAPKPGTLDNRRYSIKKLMPYFAYLKLKDITDSMYQEALDDLKRKNLSRSTLEGIHTTGKMIFKYAMRKKLITENPTIYASIQKDEQKVIEDDEEELPNYFEKEELLLFLDTIKEKGLYMDEAIFTTFSFTGMRIGELVALKWKDIDFENCTIRITKTYYNKKNNTLKYKLVPPKTLKSRRKITVDESVIITLKKHKEEQDKLISHLGDSYTDMGFIFANFRKYPGYPVLKKFVKNRMERLLKKAELNVNLTPHSLRHTHTSLLAQAGVDLEEIMDRLGHHDDDVTRKVYLHITPEMKKDASDKFGDFIRGK